LTAYEHLSAHRYDTAARHIDQYFANYGPTEAASEAHYLRGVAYAHLGKATQAREDFGESLKATPLSEVEYKSLIALGNLCFESGEDESAIVHYENALKAMPKDPPRDIVMYRLGTSLQRVGEWSKAQFVFSELRSLFPTSKAAKLGAEKFRYFHFVIQAGAYERDQLAAAETARLRRLQMPAEIQFQIVDGRGRHLVRIGKYHTLREAEAALESMKTHLKEAMILP
jgi:tetratricopeptide (TPR) repeat protein